MATQVSIALRNARAIQRLVEATRAISEDIEVPAPDIPTRNHDPLYLHASQLEALAAWAENVQSVVNKERNEDDRQHASVAAQSAKSRRTR